MTARSGGLSRGDAILIPQLAAGRSYRDAAVTAGVSERTVSRRMQDPEFRRRVREERDHFITAAGDRLAALSLQAIWTLNWLMEEGRNDHVRLGAVRAVLDYGIRLRREAREAQGLGSEAELILRQVERVEEVVVRLDRRVGELPARSASAQFSPVLENGVASTGFPAQLHRRSRGDRGMLMKDLPRDESSESRYA